MLQHCRRNLNDSDSDSDKGRGVRGEGQGRGEERRVIYVLGGLVYQERREGGSTGVRC